MHVFINIQKKLIISSKALIKKKLVELHNVLCLVTVLPVFPSVLLLGLDSHAL